MQPYPQPFQPSAQNITLQRLWWLIYGLSFGVGICIINFVYFYGIGALLAQPMDFNVYDIISGLLDAFFFLLYFSACLVAGILAARKTRRAGSAMLASLLVGVCFILSEFILQSINRMIWSVFGIRYILFVVFPVACLGIYVGFLGGLIGRTTERIKRTIGIFYAVGVILVSTAVPFFVEGLFLYYGYGFAPIYVIALVVFGSIGGMTAWIMTLIQYAQAQSWGAFTLTFFFSGVMILVYLIAGVPPRQSAQYVVLSPGAYAPGAVAYPPVQPAQAQPPQPDAVSILQQRFARGEIDAETYRQMLATITNQPVSPPQQ